MTAGRDTTTGYVTGDDLYPPVDLHTLPDVQTDAARDLKAQIEADIAKAAVTQHRVGSLEEVQHELRHLGDHARRVRDNFNRGAS